MSHHPTHPGDNRPDSQGAKCPGQAEIAAMAAKLKGDALKAMCDGKLSSHVYQNREVGGRHYTTHIVRGATRFEAR